jgi:allene oxide cyclase-like protein
MPRAALPVIVLGVVLALGVAVTSAGKGPGKPSKPAHGHVLTVIEHADTDATTDTGAPGDSAGDILTFANDVFNAADTTKVGTDQGYCIRVVAGTSYECNWTTTLARGQITVEGPFLDAGDSTMAVTGGTGRYRNARGFMKLHGLENGTKFAFEFHLIG